MERRSAIALFGGTCLLSGAAIVGVTYLPWWVRVAVFLAAFFACRATRRMALDVTP